MTTQHLNTITNTTITVDIIRAPDFEAFLADNRHLERRDDTPKTGWGFHANQGVALDARNGQCFDESSVRGFDGLLCDHHQYEAETFALMLDEIEVFDGETEDASYEAVTESDAREQRRRIEVIAGKMNRFISDRRRSKRNRSAVLNSRAKNASLRRPSRRKMTLA